MKKINFKLIFGFTVVLGLISCSDVLDESPDNRTEINSLEKISELLVSAYPESTYIAFLEPLSDNAGDKSLSAEASDLNLMMFTWQDFFDDDNDTPTNYWNTAYEAISQANQALLSLEELGELDTPQRGEALLCRAYAHYMLVNIFAKAYDPATASTDLGVTYITEPEITLLPQYARNTVQEVYDNIQSDLVEGLLYITDDYDEPKFHFTKAAANAFASRFYLTIGEWQKVIDHSNVTLGNGTGVNAIRDYTNDYRAAGLSYSERSFRYFSSIEQANLLLTVGESTYARNHYSERFQLNDDVASLLFFQGNAAGLAWSEQVFGQDLFYNTPKFDEYFRITNQAAGIGLAFLQVAILTGDETMFNRAEAYAMLGDFQSAVDDVNTLLSVKSQNYSSASILGLADITSVIDPNFYTPFYSIPADALPIIDLILETKRSVHYNEGLRWFDIKRHDIAIDHTYDKTPNNPITISLVKGDNRRALQIPTEAQARGIEPNIR